MEPKNLILRCWGSLHFSSMAQLMWWDNPRQDGLQVVFRHGTVWRPEGDPIGL